jgi:hypothetical protein
VFESGQQPTPANAQGLGLRDMEWIREQIRHADVADDTRERLLRAIDDERGSA